MIELPNELIIHIYKYTDEHTKYKMILIYKWLKNIKIFCSDKCNNTAKYILRFKIKTSSNSSCNSLYNYHKMTYFNTYFNKMDNVKINYIYFTKTICSLNCEKTLVIKHKSFDNLIKYLIYLEPYVNIKDENDYGNNYGNGYINDYINVKYYINNNRYFTDLKYEQILAHGCKLN